MIDNGDIQILETILRSDKLSFVLLISAVYFLVKEIRRLQMDFKDILAKKMALMGDFIKINHDMVSSVRDLKDEISKLSCREKK